MLPFIFSRLFHFIRLTASSAFLLYSKDNLSGSMGVKTGFPSMGPLSIYLYYFTIVATTFSPNLFIPDFSDICVNMMFVATFINESVSFFDSCHLTKKYFQEL